jgi:HSP20 family protein
MATLVRWEPYRHGRSLPRTWDGLFETALVRPRTGWLRWSGHALPAVDMYETDSEVVVKATVPGFDPDDIEVTVSEGVLIIKGTREAEEAVKEAEYICREHHSGSFSRSLTLPSDVLAEDATANYSNGILTLTLPKPEEVKAKRIEVRAG